MAQNTAIEMLEGLARQISPLVARLQRLHEEGDERMSSATMLLMARLNTVSMLSQWIGPYAQVADEEVDEAVVLSLLAVEEALDAAASSIFSEDSDRIAGAAQLLADRLDLVFAQRKTILRLTPADSRDSAIAHFEESRTALAAAREQDASWEFTYGQEARAPGSGVGKHSDLNLSLAYQRVSWSEFRISHVWTAVTVLSIGLLTWLGYATYRADPPDWLDLGRRLVLAVPLLAFLPYAISESRDHREHARWAQRIALQLVTLDPFTRRLPEEERTQIISGFGTALYDVHTGPTPGSTDGTHDGSSASEALHLMERAARLLRER